MTKNKVSRLEFYTLLFITLFFFVIIFDGLTKHDRRLDALEAEALPTCRNETRLLSFEEKVKISNLSVHNYRDSDHSNEIIYITVEVCE